MSVRAIVSPQSEQSRSGNEMIVVFASAGMPVLLHPLAGAAASTHARSREPGPGRIPGGSYVVPTEYDSSSRCPRGSILLDAIRLLQRTLGQRRTRRANGPLVANGWFFDRLRQRWPLKTFEGVEPDPVVFF